MKWLTLVNGDMIPADHVARARQRQNRDTSQWLWHLYDKEGSQLGLAEEFDDSGAFYLPARPGQHVVVYYRYDDGTVGGQRYDVIAWQIRRDLAEPVCVEALDAANTVLVIFSQEDGSYISPGDGCFENRAAAETRAQKHAEQEKKA